MTSGTASNTVAAQVLETLPSRGQGLSYQEIHARIGMWSIITIKHAVRQLKEEGLIRVSGSHQRPEFCRAPLIAEERGT